MVAGDHEERDLPLVPEELDHLVEEAHVEVPCVGGIPKVPQEDHPSPPGLGLLMDKLEHVHPHLGVLGLEVEV